MKTVDIFYGDTNPEKIYLESYIELYPNNIKIYKLNDIYDVHLKLDGGYYTWVDEGNNIHTINSVITTQGVIIKGTPVISNKKITNLCWQFYNETEGEYSTIPYGTLNTANLKYVVLRKELDKQSGKYLYFFFNDDNSKVYFNTPVNKDLAIDITESVPDTAKKIPIIKRRYII